MLNTIESINNAVNNFIWGVPAMVCIIGVGLYLSIRTNFLQIRKFSYSIRVTLGRMFRKRDASDGTMTPFQAAVPLWPPRSAPAISPEWPEPSPSVALAPYSGCGFLRFWVCVQSFPR